MRVVQPIRDRKQLEAIKTYLRGKSQRDYLMFMVGISSALRISDILNLKVSDVWDGKKPKQHIEVNEQKTGKYKRFPITKNLSKAIREFMQGEGKEKGQDDYLFTGRYKDRPMTRQNASLILKDVEDMLDLEEPFNSHSMRKTWGFHAFKSGVSLDYIVLCLNHRSVAETKRYLGILQEDLDEIYINLNL